MKAEEASQPKEILAKLRQVDVLTSQCRSEAENTVFGARSLI